MLLTEVLNPALKSLWFYKLIQQLKLQVQYHVLLDSLLPTSQTKQIIFTWILQTFERLHCKETYELEKQKFGSQFQNSSKW